MSEQGINATPILGGNALLVIAVDYSSAKGTNKSSVRFSPEVRYNSTFVEYTFGRIANVR